MCLLFNWFWSVALCDCWDLVTDFWLCFTVCLNSFGVCLFGFGVWCYCLVGFVCFLGFCCLFELGLCFIVVCYWFCLVWLFAFCWNLLVLLLCFACGFVLVLYWLGGVLWMFGFCLLLIKLLIVFGVCAWFKFVDVC